MVGSSLKWKRRPAVTVQVSRLWPGQVRQTVSIDVLMVHSPLVGPLTLTPLAAELRNRGFRVAVPDLRAALAAPRPQWQAIIDLASANAGSVDLIVAHSGAGVLMPVLADAVNAKFVAFVDAVVPGAGSSYQASDAFIKFVRSLPGDGPLLPPWHEWWGREVTARLIPDAQLAERIAADTPRVPRSFYDDPVPLPDRWETRRGCCFLQLSPAYDDDCERAAAHGWPIARIDGQHLDVVVNPAKVALALVNLIERVR